MRALPYFLDSFPRARRPEYGVLRGTVRTDVVIVGAGLTGSACAAVFAAAGVKVLLLDAERIGAGQTAASPGVVAQHLDASFQRTASAHGIRTARHVWQGFRRASLDLPAALRRLAIRAELVPQELLLFTRDADEGRQLQREYKARREGGVDCSWVSSRALSDEAGIEAAGGIRTRGEVLDPYRTCLGLAAASAVKGAQIHERTPVQRIRAGQKSVEIKTDRAVVTADAVIIATGALPADLRALRRHFAPTQSYAVVTDRLPASVRREVGSRAMVMSDTASPAHLLRWLKDDRVLFCGADGPPVAPRVRAATIVQRANQLMYELSTLYPAISGVRPAWGWDLLQHGSPDGLPVIGPHRNFPRHLFALGHGRHGVATAWLAAKLLLREYRGDRAKGDERFGFSRVL